MLPYDGRLKRFPAYLQQLDMESNGKSVGFDGMPVHHSTAPVIWGEPGNNAQHSFFQMLHQGTARAALDFLLPAQSSSGNPEQALLAIGNCLAQAEAFAFGYTLEQATRELTERKVSPARIELLARHKVHAGNRPSSIVAFAGVGSAMSCGWRKSDTASNSRGGLPFTRTSNPSAVGRNSIFSGPAFALSVSSTLPISYWYAPSFHSPR